MLRKIISGGQTGADQGGLIAAKAEGIPTGGTMPKGFHTEAGPRPDLAATYGMEESPHSDYANRTWENVRASDGTLWFGSVEVSRGYVATAKAARHYKRPIVEFQSVDQAIDWIKTNNIRTLNVAGNRASKHWEIGKKTEFYMREIIRRLKA